MQRNTTDRSTTQHSGLQHNGSQNSPQHNKTGNKNHAHVLNKPVEVTSSSTKNSTEKIGQKTLQVYPRFGLYYTVFTNGGRTDLKWVPKHQNKAF